MKGECSPLNSTYTSVPFSNLLYRNFSILSSGDVYLGELSIAFQLHIKSPPNKKDGGLKKDDGLKKVGGSKSLTTAEAKASETAAEFIVGPGATFKRSPPALVQHKLLEKTRRDVRSRENLPEVMPDLYQKPGGFETVTVERGIRSDAGHQKVSLEPTPVIGKRQMQVISELLERGTALRDKMVHSLAAGTQLEGR